METVRETPTRARITITLPFREGAGYALSVRAPNGGDRMSPAGVPWTLSIETTPGTYVPAGRDAISLQVLPTGPVRAVLRFRIETATEALLTDALRSLELPVLVVLLAPVSL